MGVNELLVPNFFCLTLVSHPPVKFKSDLCFPAVKHVGDDLILLHWCLLISPACFLAVEDVRVCQAWSQAPPTWWPAGCTQPAEGGSEVRAREANVSTWQVETWELVLGDTV